jgi:hypothetical protein
MLSIKLGEEFEELHDNKNRIDSSNTPGDPWHGKE